MSDNREFDPFGGSTGLIDDFDIEITEAVFGYDSKIGNGEALLLKLGGKTDDPDAETIEVDGEDALKITCGKSWSTEQDGKLAVHDSGKPKNFNKQTHYFEFFTRALELAPDLREWHAQGPFNAELWVGTKWHLKREEKTYTIQGKEQQSQKLMPQAFLGRNGKPSKSSKPSKQATAAEEPASQASAPAAASSNGELPDEIASDKKLLLQLKQAAKGKEDLIDFQTAALEIAGLPNDVSVNLMDDDYAASVFAGVK